MKPSFDLVSMPWIPCIRKSGEPVELGLRDALVLAHEVTELGGESPLVETALYRLLLAVLHRVFGPASPEEWDKLWRAGRWEVGSLDVYLDRWRPRFDLLHPERPFYQSADPRVKPKPVLSLVFELASGNNATLFDHHTEEEGVSLSLSEAARMLVAAQAFGLAGTKGPKMQFTDAPCARGALFLVQGETLFETLALNLLQYPTTENVMPHSPDDRPSWETEDPFTPDRTRPMGCLDYLTWQNRHILLFPEAGDGGIVVRQMTVAPALRLADDVLDPMKHYRRDEKRGFLELRFREERALWRDSAALFWRQVPGLRPPLVFDWLAGLADRGYLDLSSTRRYMALGMANRLGRVDFYRGERMPLPLRYLKDEHLVEALDEVLKMAEAVGRQVWGATTTLVKFVLSLGADAMGARPAAREELDRLTEQWGVERRYWSRLELPFRETMEELPRVGREKALPKWQKTLRRTAWEAFEQAVRGLGESPRCLKAGVQARGQLAAGLARVLPGS